MDKREIHYLLNFENPQFCISFDGIDHNGGERWDTVRWIEDGITSKPIEVKLNASLLAVRSRSIALWEKPEKSVEMKNKTFSKISKDKQRSVVGLRVGQKVSSVTLCHHTKLNAINRSRFYFHRESKTVLSNFCEIVDFRFFAIFLSSTWPNRSSWRGPELKVS